MPAHYSNNEINQIAASVLQQHPPPVLLADYRRFLWSRIGMPTAWLTRNALAVQLKDALTGGSRAQLQTAADDIHRWGFGPGIPEALNRSPDFWVDLETALQAFHAANANDLLACAPALTALLAHKRLGIARVSKWVCFVDQDRYAIFDSRVSIALRNVTTANGERAFPIVGRRTSRGQAAWPASVQVLSSPLRTARCYIDYLRVIGMVSTRARPLSPAQVEMALFMAGNVWPNGNPQLPPLTRGMWG